MNCQKGDLAVIVRSDAGNEGKIVRCLRFLPRKSWRIPNGRIVYVDSWEVDTPVKGWAGDSTAACMDERLRPIRDQPGEDETLTWAPVPSTVEA